MRAHSVRSLALAVAVFALAGTAVAQEKSAILNTAELKQLVASSAPADHARLGAHFTALADRYAAEAKRHSTMAQSFVGNPNRNLGAGMSAHCKRLTELNTQAATAARELSAYHRKVAGGATATPPRDAAKYEAGAGTTAPTEKELSALAEKANTPAQHQALEEYFLSLAKRYTAEANEHATFAQTYRGGRTPQVAVYHDRLTNAAREAAKEATAAAEMHKGLAAR